MEAALPVSSFREAAEELAAWWARREPAGPQWRWVSPPGALPSQGGGYLELPRAPCASRLEDGGVGGSVGHAKNGGGLFCGAAADGDEEGKDVGHQILPVPAERRHRFFPPPARPSSPPSPSARSTASSPSSFPSSPSSAASLDFPPSSPDSARLRVPAVGLAGRVVQAEYVVAWSEPYECPVLLFLPLDAGGCPVLCGGLMNDDGGAALRAFAPALFGGREGSGCAAARALSASAEGAFDSVDGVDALLDCDDETLHGNCHLQSNPALQDALAAAGFESAAASAASQRALTPPPSSSQPAPPSHSPAPPLFPPASLEMLPGIPRPMFMMHPCQTQEVMRILTSGKEGSERAVGGSEMHTACRHRGFRTPLARREPPGGKEGGKQDPFRGKEAAHAESQRVRSPELSGSSQDGLSSAAWMLLTWLRYAASPLPLAVPL